MRSFAVCFAAHEHALLSVVLEEPEDPFLLHEA